MKLPEHLLVDPALRELDVEANDLHVLTIETHKSLREFLASSLSYMPGWMRFLYGVRRYFVMLLGTRQKGIPKQENLRPEDVSFTPGDMATFFRVSAAQEDRFWMAEARDRMIVGHIAVVREPMENGMNRMHFISGATYLRWTGRIYYNAILPFHHVVVRCMVSAA